MGSTHRAFGAVAGLGYGTVAGLPLAGMLACGALGTVTSAGLLSPDVDQRWGWRLADTVVPDELLGGRGPLQHRGISHWWGLALAVTALWWAALVVPLAGDGGRGDLVAHGAGALLAGWWSHLAGDLVFGRADRWSGRGPGIPLLPWWGHAGLGLDVGGRLEKVTLGVLWLAAAAQVLAAVGLLGRVLDAGRTVVAGG